MRQTRSEAADPRSTGLATDVTYAPQVSGLNMCQVRSPGQGVKRTWPIDHAPWLRRQTADAVRGTRR
jgi:hypothetical protein